MAATLWESERKSKELKRPVQDLTPQQRSFRRRTEKIMEHFRHLSE